MNSNDMMRIVSEIRAAVGTGRYPDPADIVLLIDEILALLLTLKSERAALRTELATLRSERDALRSALVDDPNDASRVPLRPRKPIAQRRTTKYLYEAKEVDAPDYAPIQGKTLIGVIGDAVRQDKPAFEADPRPDTETGGGR